MRYSLLPSWSTHLPASFHEYWVIPEKIQRRDGLMIYVHFWKNPWNLYICHFTLIKQAFTPENSTDFATLLGNSKTKNPRTMENPHDFFLITPRKSPLKISACFFKYPLKFHVLSSPYLVFFWNRGEIKGGWIRKYQVLFFMLRQLKTTDCLRNSDEVAWNLAISEANLCRGSQNGFFKTTKHFWKILWNLQRKTCARASFKNILQL